MFLPTSSSTTRSLRKSARKPLRELPSIPIHDKYVIIIDKYLLNSKKNLQNQTKKPTPALAQLFPPSENSLYSKTMDPARMFVPSRTLKTSNKPCRFAANLGIQATSTIFHKPETQKKISIKACSVTIMKPKASISQRARSVQIRKTEKKNCNIQTDISAIVEYDSPDEESPMKYRSRYD